MKKKKKIVVKPFLEDLHDTRNNVFVRSLKFR
jgi:hypothetical protein